MNLFHPIYMYALYAAICCCDHVQMQKPLWGNRLLKILHSVFQLLKQFILMQRTKSTLRNIAGHLCGTWKRMTTTKEHAKSATRRTTCTSDGSVNASGSSGTFLPPLTQTLLLLAHPLSSDWAVRPGPLWGASVWTQVVKDSIEDKHCWLGRPNYSGTHSLLLFVCLCSQTAPLQVSEVSSIWRLK